MIPTGIEAEVADDLARRQKLGIAKYGATVAENPLQQREWLQHAYEEALDLAVYLKRLINDAEKSGVDGVFELRVWAALSYIETVLKGDLDISGRASLEMVRQILTGN